MEAPPLKGEIGSLEALTAKAVPRDLTPEFDVDLLDAAMGDETIIDVGLRWPWGFTPLHLAIRGMNVPIMEPLIRFIDTNWPEAINLTDLTDNIKEPLVNTKLVKNARHWLNDRYECDSLVDT
ncbi:unnamed protein product [Sphagnum jensenii]|uniref:Ankyrin repeat protein n=1 Tax=Sphagnum jensenii TaxID=128206 RepID=A0ABP0WHH8_9BRYO